MTTVKKTRIKAQTLEAPQSREETQRWIRELGDLQREHGRTTAEMNDQIAEITHSYTPELNALQARIDFGRILSSIPTPNPKPSKAR